MFDYAFYNNLIENSIIISLSVFRFANVLYNLWMLNAAMAKNIY